MTTRQTGRRIAAMPALRRRKSVKRGGNRQAGRRRKDEALRPKERRQLLQLVICGGVFVLLVAAKLLLPERMEQINMKISNAMEQNMDVQAVFSAVGRAFSGESEVNVAADEVYRAVFHPEEELLVEEAVQVSVAGDAASLAVLRGYRTNLEVGIPPDGVAKTETASESPVEEQAEATTLTYVLYSDQNLPEGVSMEQVILGFDYCTPVSGSISSDFGYRDHPTEGEERFHYGVDLAADTGTDINCFADGTVTVVGESSSYGKYCIVAHEGGYSTLYAHCSRVTASSGACVEEGEKIGEVGETGIATGPHLHFELQRDGVYLNPIYYVSAI